MAAVPLELLPAVAKLARAVTGLSSVFLLCTLAQVDAGLECLLHSSSASW